MQSNNFVLNRISEENPPSNNAGFAYNEGRKAYTHAATTDRQATDGTIAANGYQVSPTVDPAVTLNDVITKTGISLAVLLVGAVIGWQLTPSLPLLPIGAMVVGLGLGLANTFMKQVRPPLILLYAFVEGVFLGGISYIYDQMVQQVQYEGLVSQAIIGTLVAFGVMLTLYSTRIIKVNGTFMKVFTVAIISYCVIAVVSFIAAFFFNVGGGFGFYGVGPLGLLLCAFGVLLAAFTLNLDFAAVEQGIAQELPERESWRMSFGLMVTLVWLYLEILRLLTLLARD